MSMRRCETSSHSAHVARRPGVMPLAFGCSSPGCGSVAALTMPRQGRSRLRVCSAFFLRSICPSAHRKANSWRGAKRHRLDVRHWGNSWGGATMPASAPVRVRSIVVHLHEIGAEQSLDANPGIGEIVEISDVDRVNGNAVPSHHNACYEPSGSGDVPPPRPAQPRRRRGARKLGDGCSCLEAPYDRARLTSRRALLEPRPAC